MSKIKCVCDAVADVGAEDDSLVSCPAATIAAGGFVAGDTVLIKGKKGKDTLAILVADDACEAGKVRMSATCRRNLGLALGDTCFLSAPAAEVQFATSVKVLPYDDSVKGETDTRPMYAYAGSPFRVKVRQRQSGSALNLIVFGI
jgi:hypothetical protein